MSDSMKTSVSIELIDEFSNKLSAINKAFDTLAANAKEVQTALSSLSSSSGFETFRDQGRKSFGAVRLAAVKFMATLSLAQQAIAYLTASLAAMGKYGALLGKILLVSVTPLTTASKSVNAAEVKKQVDKLKVILTSLKSDFSKTTGRIIADLRRLRSRFMQFANSLKTLYGNIGKLKNRFEQLQLTLNNSANKLLDNTNKIKDARLHTDTLTTSVNNLNNAMKQTGTISTRLGPLGARRGGSPLVGPGLGGFSMDELGGSLTDAGGRMKGMGAAALGAAGGMFGAASYAVNQSMNLESSKIALKNTLDADPEKAKADLKKLNEEAIRLGNTLPGTTKDMLDMFTALRIQGAEAEQVYNGLGDATAKFAVLNNLDFQTAGVNVFKFGKALGLDANSTTEDYNFLIDAVTRLNGVSSVDPSVLFETMKYLGSKTVKLTQFNTGDKSKDKKLQQEAINDIFAMLAVTSDRGIEGSMAGTGISAALTRMAQMDAKMAAKKFEPYREMFADKGISLNFYDENGKFAGIKQMIEELGKLKVLEQKDQDKVLYQLFGDQASRVMSAFIDGGSEAFTAKRQGMANQLGTDVKIKNIMASSAQQLGLLKANWETLVAAIGDKLSSHFDIAELFKKATEALQKLIAWIEDPKHQRNIDEYIEKAKSLFLWLVKMGAALTGIGTVLSTIGGAVTGLMAFKKLFDALQLSRLPGLFRSFRAGLLSSARGLSVFRRFSWLQRIVRIFSSFNAISLAIAAAALLIYKYWEPLKNFFSGFWEGLQQGWENFRPVFDRFKEIFDDIAQRVSALFGGQVKGDMQDFANGAAAGVAVIETLGDILGFAADLIQAIIMSVEDIGTALGTSFSYFVDGPFLDDLNSIWEAIKEFFAPITDNIYYLYQAIVQTVEDINELFNRILKGVKDAVLNAVAWVKERFSTLINTFKNIGESVIDSFVNGLKAGWQRINDFADKIKELFHINAEVKLPEAPATASWEEAKAKGDAVRAKQAGSNPGASDSISGGSNTTVNNNDNKTVSFNFYGVGENSVAQLTAAADRLNFGMA